MAQLFTAPTLQALNANGSPYSGAKLHFYQTGTTTAITVYQDDDATTPHSNPVIADSSGRFAPIYVNTDVFKVVLTDADDVTIQTVDPVNINVDEMFGIAGVIEDDELLVGDPADTTKRTRLDAGNVTAGETWPMFVGKGANVASASTLTLGAGNFFHVTGTTTITDIDFSTAYDGRWAILEFDGALTLTHNSTTLVLKGGANITTAAGDTCMVVQDNDENIHVVMYERAAAGWNPPVMTPYVSYTPTLTGFGTATSVAFRSCRVGSNLLIYGRFTAGTSTAVEARISLGFNGTDGNVAVSSIMDSAIWVVGSGAENITAAAQFVLLATGGQSYLKVGLQSSGREGLTAANGNVVLPSSGNIFAFMASVPIEGWS